MVIGEDTVSTAFPIGSTFLSTVGFVATAHEVKGYDGSRVLVQPTGIAPSGLVICTKQDGLEFNPTIIM
jgi:hypothetical protein